MLLMGIGRGDITKWVAWIAAFTFIAGFFWPAPVGVVLMGLGFFGVIHLGVLVFEEISLPQYNDKMMPVDYEHYCADILRKRGWNARVTKASGDQGADIIADKRKMRIVVQCKKYSKPVGNFAVQEIAAAIAHVDADYGIVVATNGFTRSAYRLALSNDIFLLHHSELHRIDRLLKK
jgi:restriction system protein